MNEPSTLTALTEQYKARGYDVKIRPEEADLPDFALQGGQIDAIARKGREVVLFQVKWQGDDPKIMTSSDAGLDYVDSLFLEAESLMQASAFRSALLIAWAAVEAAAREFFRQQGLEPSRFTPRELIVRLAATGSSDSTVTSTLFQCLGLRNTIVHGMRPKTFLLSWCFSCWISPENSRRQQPRKHPQMRALYDAEGQGRQRT